MTDQPTPRAPERATEALRFVDEFLAVGGNGEGWTGEHLRAVVAWGLGRELGDRGLMLARGVLGSDLIDSPPAPEPKAPGDLREQLRWQVRETYRLADERDEALAEIERLQTSAPDDLRREIAEAISECVPSPCNRFLDAAEALMQQVAAYSATQTGTADHGMIHAAGRLRVVLNSYRHDYVADPGAPRPCGCHPAVPEPTAPDDLQRDITEALGDLDECRHSHHGCCQECASAAVMDVLRRNGVVR